MQTLLLDFLKVTENAAISVIPWVGGGNKMNADQASTNMMRKTLNDIAMSATVVIGEGEIDEAPMLYIGEKLGRGGLAVDIAVDPIDGTTPAAKGEDNAITVIAAAPIGTLLHAPDMYMEKMIVGPKIKGKIDIDRSIEENLEILAIAANKKVSDLQIMIQDRPRHQEYIDRIHATGAKVQLFCDGDIMYSIAACIGKDGADMLFGIGGAPEGVISAVAMRCLGGDMQARLLPCNENEKIRCIQMGIKKIQQKLTIDDLISTDKCLFVATGITNNPLLKGIRHDEEGIVTNSILLCGKEKKMRFVNTVYNKIQDLNKQ